MLFECYSVPVGHCRPGFIRALEKLEDQLLGTGRRVQQAAWQHSTFSKSCRPGECVPPRSR